jgi:hypothetical protein
MPKFNVRIETQKLAIRRNFETNLPLDWYRP